MPELVQRGEDLILPCSDPAVTVTPGYRRYLVGLDIAQSIDANAFAIILDERVTPKNSGRAAARSFERSASRRWLTRNLRRWSAT